MTTLFNIINTLFERVRTFWDGHFSKSATAAMILLVYLLSLTVIELGRRGLLPQNLAPLIPRSHYAAINIAFTFLLYLELIDLVFGLAKSVSRSVGKQFEIFSLILSPNCRSRCIGRRLQRPCCIFCPARAALC